MKNFRLDIFKEKMWQNGLPIPLDILLVGATGVGKSSTINALFGSEIAKVGYGVDPETQHIKDYSFHGYLRIHDSAGLGDGEEADNRHAINIINKLYKKNSDDNLFIVTGKLTRPPCWSYGNGCAKMQWRCCFAAVAHQCCGRAMSLAVLSRATTTPTARIMRSRGWTELS